MGFIVAINTALTAQTVQKSRAIQRVCLPCSRTVLRLYSPARTATVFVSALTL